MNNSLDLEIVNAIKNVLFFLTKANSHLVIKEFHKCLELYDEAFNIYVANKAYNSSVSQHYEGVILSLKGFVCMTLGDYDQAESLFNASLKINCHDTLTLMRRSILFSKINRLSEAIEDAEKVYISNPECNDLKEILNILEEQIGKLDNEDERLRLEQNLGFLKGDDSSFENIEINEDEILSFSNLKSIEKTSTSNHLKVPNISKNSYVFSKQSVLEEEVESSDEVDEGKLNRRTPCTHLLKTQSICMNPKHPHLQKELQRSSEFAGFMEEKLQRRTSVKFSENTENANEKTIENKTENQTPKLKKAESEKRKSCLRTSKYSSKEFISQSQNLRRSSSFLDIKNIDGTYISLLNSKMVEPQLQNNETNKSLSESESDDESNEYSIYGNRLREISITRYLGKYFENLENMMGCGENREEKKNSILKNSLVFSHRSSKESKGGQKKSVCFADENSKPLK